MIVYKKRWWGLPLLGRWYGSALTRGLPSAVVAACFALILALLTQKELEGWWRHPYPYAVFSFVVGFVLVFRNNNAYSRYMEGTSAVYSMSARWAELATQLLAFEYGDYAGHDEDGENGLFRARILHGISLLHAICLQRLRRDADLGNLFAHDETLPPPFVDAIDILKWGEAHELKNVIVLDTSRSHRSCYASAQKLPVIGSISQVEMAAFSSTILERPTIAEAWVYREIVRRQQAGGLGVPPPILSRSFQTIGEGMLAFEQCRKIADTPFPFVSAQLAVLLVVLHMVSVPILFVAWINSTALAVLLTFVVVWTYWSLHEVARDLEDPYLYDPNELPFPLFQHAFNTRLIAMGRFGYL